MPLFAQSNRSALLFRKETLWGETPVANAGAAWNTLRITSESLDLDKKTTRSEVIRPDRMTDALLYTGRSIAGDVSGELSFGDWDTLFACALASSWVIGGSTTATAATWMPVAMTWNGTTNVGTLTITAAPTSGGLGTNWSSYGVIPNTILSVKGYTNAVNNGNIYVTAVNGSALTFLMSPGVTAIPETTTINYHYEYLLNSTQTPSLVIEKQFLDIGEYAYYNGLYVDTFSLDITAMDIIKIKFGFMGKDTVASGASVVGNTSGTHIIAAGTTPPVTASVNVGELLVNGLPVATGLKSLKVDATNNYRIQEVIASATPGGFGQGSFDLKGSTEAYFEDLSLWNMILNHSNVSQFASTKDVTGNEYGFGIPLANFTKGTGKVGGKNQDIMLPLEWEASRDPLTNAMIAISRASTVAW